MLLTIFLLFANWYYFPSDSPSTPVKIESLDLKLKEDELAFTFFSLTDGEATLIQHPNGETVLINSGGTMTKSETKMLLELNKINEIPKVVLTNDEKSNIQNLKWLMDEYHVKEVYTIESTAAKISPNEAVSLFVWKEGTTQEILPGVSIEVLNVEKDMDLSVEFLDNRVLFLNSVNQSSEKKLLAQQFANTKIVQFGSYGNKHLISDELIKHLDPQIAIFFHEKDKKPEQELIQRLAEAWIDVYHVKRHGTIIIKFTDNNYEVITIANEEK